MKKLFQLSTSSHVFINYIGLAGFSAFFLLNIAALVEYGKYALGISNRFVFFLPVIKLLLNIDLLFVVALIMIYNAIEKFLTPNLCFIVTLLIGIAGALYILVKGKPLAMISILGVYSIGISLFTSIIGFGSLIQIEKKKTRHKANHNES
ncbi:hypothetical protein HNQ80_001426 [Anaerosolibacter carboniphilus]|uniref:Uncharacterized protein n=1 Tax=Anaerosolibacter carboniphilus TaxID=1417629 RepID=A0A841KPH3_9FIRM|nr:hypothetical protein [Anaerosolibacter carboniphilus]MBB6215337.1 hypothetical protein [Anaerosolibacter carboniphilus]